MWITIINSEEGIFHINRNQKANANELVYLQHTIEVKEHWRFRCWS